MFQLFFKYISWQNIIEIHIIKMLCFTIELGTNIGLCNQSNLTADQVSTVIYLLKKMDNNS
jgi:hypothetical protein